MADWILAIDFGTTSTAAAMRVGETLARIEIDGAPRMPSMVFWREDTSGGQTGRLVLGEEADELSGLAPWCLERTPKRRIGDEFIRLGDKELRVTDVIGAILRKVADEAIRLRGGQMPAELRLTYPARWSRMRLAKLQQAARIAGFDSPVFIPEPVAAAMHFASERLAAGQVVAVYDLGGGTFDTAVLRRTDRSFEVVGAPGGDNNLGGEDFDDRLYRYLGRQIAQDKWQMLRASQERAWAQANRELLRNARRTKEFLSRSPQYEFYMPPPIDQELLASAETFRELIMGDVDATVVELERTIGAAGLEPSELAAIYLAGGSSRIPLIGRMIQQRLGQMPESLDDPKAVTVLGAARVPLGGATNGRTRKQETVPKPRVKVPEQTPTLPLEHESPVLPGQQPAHAGMVLTQPHAQPHPQPDTQPQPEPQAQPQPQPQTQPQPHAATPLETPLATTPAETTTVRKLDAPATGEAGRVRARGLAQALMIAGCVGLAADSFLRWTSVNFWHTDHSLHFKVVAIGLLVATLALSVLTLKRPADAWTRMAGAAGLFAGGGVLAYALVYTSFQPVAIGTYLSIVCSVALLAGGLLAVLEGPDATSTEPSSPLAPLVIIAACLALTADSFLHWTDLNFWRSGQSLHFKAAVIAFLVAAVIASAVSLVRPGIWSRLAGAAALCAGGSVLLYALEFTSYNPVGTGVYLGIVFALVAGAAGLIAVLTSGGALRDLGRRLRPESLST